MSSEISYERFRSAFNAARLRAGWFIKLVALALIWAYLHHFIAGLRHLWMDVHARGEQAARRVGACSRSPPAWC